MTELFRIPPVTTPDLFQDALTQLTKKTAKAKGFDVSKVIDNSFLDDAMSRGIGKTS